MYELNSRVRYSETDIDAKLSLTGIMNYMQDCSTMQSEDAGVGIGYLGREKKAWLLSSWQIVIGRRPVLGERIKVLTWPYAVKGLYALRNFAILDEKGEYLVKANSYWFLMNTETGRPMRITDADTDPYGEFNPKIEMEDAPLMRYIKKKGFKTVTDFYVEIAEERLDPNQVIDEYLEQLRRETETNEHTEVRSAEEYITTTEVEEISTNKDVLVIDQNLTGIEYKLARCCNPIYGDEVFGFVSTQGIKIHRMDCPNAQEMFSRFGYRIIQAKWSGKGDNGYIVTLRVIGRDDIAIVTNITSVISKEAGVTLRSLNIDSVDGIFQGNFTVMVRDTTALNMLTKKINAVKGVKTVERLNS